MGGRAFDFVEDAAEMRGDDQAEFVGGGGALAAGFIESGEQAIERVVLAEEEDFVLAAEIVVEIGGGEVSGSGDVAHAGFGEAAGTECAAGGAEDFQAAGEVAAAEARWIGGGHSGSGLARIDYGRVLEWCQSRTERGFRNGTHVQKRGRFGSGE